MRHWYRQLGFHIICSLLWIAASVSTVAFAATVTPLFPYFTNDFTEGEVIEEEDWNAIEAYVGTRTTNASSTSLSAAVIGGMFNATSSIQIGGTATNTISAAATSTLQKGLRLVDGALDLDSTTASSTFANGIVLEGGCLYVNGACLVTSAVSGSGAANKVAFWSGAAALSSDTNFHFDSTNVRLGIGTTSPYAKLSVAGEAVASHFSATSTTATSTLSGFLDVGRNIVTGGYVSASRFLATSTETSTFVSAPTFSSLTSALVLTGAGGLTAEYTGTSCTNQFPRSLDALGVATCASVANADLTNSSLTVTAGGGLIGGGAVSLGGSVTLTAQIGTSSVPTLGHLATWTGAGTPSTLGTVATTSLTADSPLSLSQPISVIGASASSLTCSTCVLTTRALTIAGTANQITSSAGAQDLSADRTWTLSLPSLVVFPGNASSTQLTTTGSTYLATTAGNIGIGTTSPAAKLAVQSTLGVLPFYAVAPDGTNVTGFNFIFENQDGNDIHTGGLLVKGGAGGSSNAVQLFAVQNTAGTNLVTVNASGNVGIGTTSPSNKLAIGSLSSNGVTLGGTNPILELDETGSSLPVFRFKKSGVSKWSMETDTTFAQLILRDQVNGRNNLILENDGDVLLASSGTGNVGIGTTSPANLLDVNGVLRVGVQGDNANLLYVNTAASFGGRIGLGTTSPGARLDVDTTSVSQDGIRIFGNTPTFRLYTTSTNANSRNYAINVGYDVGNFEINQSSVVGGEPGGTNRVFAIDLNGNIGIASTSPYGRFSVEQGTEAASLWVANTGSTTPSFIVSGVNGNGRVGVATSSPLSSFTVCDTCTMSIPYASSPSASRPGEIAINTATASSTLVVNVGGTKRPIYLNRSSSFFIASTTITGTTTRLFLNDINPFTLNSFYCKTNIGTVFVRFGDGTNWTTQIQCTTSGAVTSGTLTNNSFVGREDFGFQIGTPASSPTEVWITFERTYDSNY